MSIYSVATADVALSAATAKTVVQIKAASTKRLRIVEWGLSFEGATASNEPADVRFLRQTTDGTPGSSPTPVEWDEGGEASVATGHINFSSEPTAGDVLSSYQVTPNGGLLVIQYPLGREPVVAVSGRIGLEVTAANAVDVRAYMVFEE